MQRILAVPRAIGTCMAACKLVAVLSAGSKRNFLAAFNHSL